MVDLKGDLAARNSCDVDCRGERQQAKQADKRRVEVVELGASALEAVAHRPVVLHREQHGLRVARIEQPLSKARTRSGKTATYVDVLEVGVQVGLVRLDHEKKQKDGAHGHRRPG